MPELPEVETTCRGLMPHITNQTIIEILIRNSKLRWPVPEDLPIILQNQKLLNITRRAKYILFNFASGTLLIHLGMSGSMRLCDNSTPFLKHEHIDIQFSNGKHLRYHDPRRFGCMLWTENPKEHFLLKKLGMEPLTAEFSADYLFELTSNKNVGIKKLLMDAKYIVGVGNIYACEALFYAKIHPNTIAKSLNHKQCSALVLAIKDVLTNSIAIGGTTLRDFVNSAGEPGYFSQRLAVYGRNKLPCTICSTKIDMIIIGQRRSDFCPTCQVL